MLVALIYLLIQARRFNFKSFNTTFKKLLYSAYLFENAKFMLVLDLIVRISVSTTKTAANPQMFHAHNYPVRRVW